MCGRSGSAPGRGRAWAGAEVRVGVKQRAWVGVRITVKVRASTGQRFRFRATGSSVFGLGVALACGLPMKRER